MPRKIVLAYVSAGAGHKSACMALQKAYLQLHPEDQVQVVDILKYAPWPFKTIYAEGYLLVANLHPTLWGWIYNKQVDIYKGKKEGIFSTWLNQFITKRFQKFITNISPDVVISAHFLSSWAAAEARKKNALNFVLGTVVTDYALHSAWLVKEQDLFFVSTEEIQWQLIKHKDYLGLDKKEIIVSGIPIDPVYAQKKDKNKLREKRNLQPDLFTILILGGMAGSTKINDIISSILRIHLPFQLMMVSGANFCISAAHQKEMKKRGIPCVCFGYIDFMDEVMQMADLALTKAGGLVCTECMSKGLPVVIFRPYPGQEERNTDYFLEQGAAMKVNQLDSLDLKIIQLMENPEKLDKLSENALHIVNPSAALDIVKRIDERVQSKRAAAVNLSSL
ncbi:MAG TPA: glycosyltransferase [candidate division Zixibacteria bacterium]